MTQNEMIEMARQAQMPFYWRTGEITYLDKLEAFANLVVHHAKAEEREACAKLLEEAAQAAKDIDPQGFVWIAIKTSAEGIRARGQV
jgi:hypothetical protein